MIILDTNVVSEPMNPHPDAQVVAWLNAQALETLCLSVITVAELRAGAALLPAGKRREALRENLETRVLPLFTGRVLPVDMACTESYAQLLAHTRAAGMPIHTADALIAATALAYGHTVATRDETPFLAAGVSVINPWATP